LSLRFDVDADLTPLFNWNTKQLFVWIETEYTNGIGLENKLVVWDNIIQKRRDAKLKYKQGPQKYLKREISQKFGNETVFTLKYNVMPYVGLLTQGEAARTAPIRVPAVARER